MKKGIVPIVLGSAVTATGLGLLRSKHNRFRADNPFAWGIAGFGLAHIVLGAIDAVKDDF